MADLSAEIAEIEEILNSGVTQSVTDGVTVAYDHASLREQLRRLKRLDDASKGSRPLMMGVDLSGAT